MINRYQLSNGVRVVEEPMPSIRSTSIGIWILSGSRNETNRNNGISHLIEHMLFKGTPTRSARNIAESFDTIGGHANAFTSKEYTCLYAKVLDQNAHEVLDLMFDMFFNSSFNEEELEREKNVIYEEIAMTEDTPDDIIHDYLHNVSFGNHPLSFPILGDEEALKQIDRDKILSYKDQYYSSDRIVISVAGSIPEGFDNKIDKLFSTIPDKSSSNDLLTTSYSNETLLKKKETSQAHLCLGYPGVHIGDHSIYALTVLNNVFGGSMSSRLFQKIREEMGLTYSIFSYHSSFRDNGLLTIYGATTTEQLDLLEDEIYKIIEDIKQHGITRKELDKTLQQLNGQIVLGMENPNSRMHHNGRNELLEQSHLTVNELIQAFENVTLNEIQKIADYIFKNQPSKACILPSNV
ncbi:M16 family metallopeptidase [Tenuibacillus multivorans]|uniref:Predicted Zn-dependent peptidase n=1 Tax=Tenuibacillus multivorans TaxID=237069 RepID=A0A1G9XVX5_9BACI|nr:pitrilysin family protein [Tenuibacillus multivorans]GEL75828.1 putative zinc protease YmxG [Tenuibacillus multivorans]SDN00621.1 Predicted Zn-dependent peptidase [Tenuibacillus multivorans]